VPEPGKERERNQRRCPKYAGEFYKQEKLRGGRVGTAGTGDSFHEIFIRVYLNSKASRNILNLAVVGALNFPSLVELSV